MERHTDKTRKRHLDESPGVRLVQHKLSFSGEPPLAGPEPRNESGATTATSDSAETLCKICKGDGFLYACTKCTAPYHAICLEQDHEEHPDPSAEDWECPLCIPRHSGTGFDSSKRVCLSEVKVACDAATHEPPTRTIPGENCATRILSTTQSISDTVPCPGRSTGVKIGQEGPLPQHASRSPLLDHAADMIQACEETPVKDQATTVNSIGACSPATSECNEPRARFVTPLSDTSAHDPHDTALLIKSILEDGHFDHCSADALKNSNLYSLGDEIPDVVDKAWRQNTLNPPVVVTANGCFHSSEPTFEELWIMASKTKGKVFVNGDPVNIPEAKHLALLQLHVPNHDRTAFIIGLQPHPSDRTFAFSVPKSLKKYTTAHMEDDVIYNVTPTYSFVDLHVDYGADGVSKTLGDCVKYWFLFPPTTLNLDLLASVHGDSGKLGKLLPKLEHGIISRTKSDEALYIPSGCIHATWTTVGGFLVTKDFVTTNTCGAIAPLMTSRLFKHFERESANLCLQWFIRALDIAVTYHKFGIAYDAWIAVHEIVGARDNAKSIIRRAEEYFEYVLQHDDTERETCPCGEALSVAFEDHWRKEHLRV